VPYIIRGNDMKPEEFTSFDDSEPIKNKWIIVTNNINAKNAYGEMSHVWLTTFWTHSPETQDFGIVSYDEAGRKIIGITHWKYP